MNWKLTAGKLRDAWRDYPAQRRRLAALPPGPPIFLTGTHRSGTTWMAKMLSCSGAWYVHEPFAPAKGRWPRPFEFRPDGASDPAIDAFFTEVLEGGFREAAHVAHAEHPLMPMRIFGPPRAARMLVKDPLGCLLTGYLTRRFSLQTLVLFRHPAGFASSVHRLGWPRGKFLSQFLDDEDLMATHLEPWRDLLSRYRSEDSLASAVVLHGALNVVLWSFVSQGVGRALKFEDYCIDPIARIRELFESLGIPYDAQTESAHLRITSGPGGVRANGYRAHEVVRDSRAMPYAWASKLTDAELEQIRDIWDRFDLPLYRDPREWNRADLLATCSGETGGR